MTRDVALTRRVLVTLARFFRLVYPVADDRDERDHSDAMSPVDTVSGMRPPPT